MKKSDYDPDVFFPMSLCTLRDLKEWVAKQPDEFDDFRLRVRKTDGVLQVALSVDFDDRKVTVWH